MQSPRSLPRGKCVFSSRQILARLPLRPKGRTAHFRCASVLTQRGPGRDPRAQAQPTFRSLETLEKRILRLDAAAADSLSRVGASHRDCSPVWDIGAVGWPQPSVPAPALSFDRGVGEPASSSSAGCSRSSRAERPIFAVFRSLLETVPDGTLERRLNRLAGVWSPTEGLRPDATAADFHRGPEQLTGLLPCETPERL